MVRLGDVCIVVSGSTPKTNVPEYWDGDVKWITPAELNEDSFYITDTVRHISETGKEKTGLSYMPKGTVLLSSRAPIGKTAIADCELCCNQGFKNLICSDAIYNEYLYFFLKGNTEYLNSLGRGATFKEISKSIVEDIQIPLPSIKQQKTIAEQLKKVENLIALRKQQLAKLDDLVKARFVEMFGDPVENTKKWTVHFLCDVCTKLTDGTHFSPESYETGEYRYVTAKNIKISGFDFSNITYVNADVHNEIYARCNPEYGDVLYIKDGVTTGIAMVNTLHEPFTMLSSVALLKQNRAIVDGTYLCGVLNNQHMYDAIRSDMGGAAITRLTITKLNRIEIPVPPLALQQQFTTFVEQIDKSKSEIQTALTKLETLKKALMQQYFG